METDHHLFVPLRLFNPLLVFGLDTHTVNRQNFVNTSLWWNNSQIYACQLAVSVNHKYTVYCIRPGILVYVQLRTVLLLPLEYFVSFTNVFILLKPHNHCSMSNLNLKPEFELKYTTKDQGNWGQVEGLHWVNGLFKLHECETINMCQVISATFWFKRIKVLPCLNSSIIQVLVHNNH